MVTKQLLASGGAWLNIDNTRMLLDPGPGSLVHAIKKQLSPATLDAIILSHKHIDHSNDINIMVEAMAEGGFKKRGIVFAPSDAFGEDGVILNYLRNYADKWEILEAGKSFQIRNVTIQTSAKHHHPVETYGFIFKTSKYAFSWITDTKYFEELGSIYKGDLIIVNMVFQKPIDKVDHLSVQDVKLILEEIKPKTALITHFGMSVWQEKPWIIADRLSQDTGVRVIAAEDGGTFHLSSLTWTNF